jgi:hypothetical protein
VVARASSQSERPKRKAKRKVSATGANDDTLVEIGLTEAEASEHASARSLTLSFPEDPEESYDPTADWSAWRRTPQERGPGLFSVHPDPIPSDKAVAAAQLAASRHLSGPGPRPDINAEVLSQAAALTAYFGDVEIAFTKVPVYRGDLLLDALNRYPHPAAAACRWLIPGLRNFFGEPREGADELWSHWHHEHDRLHRLSLHPSSFSFQGRHPRHNLIDYEPGPQGTAPSRAHLERWRLTAHLMDVPPAWTFQGGRCVERRRPVSVGRLNRLIRSAKMDDAASISDRQDTDLVIQPLRTYLLHLGADNQIPPRERRQYRECLVVINEAIVSGLVRRSTFRLDHDHVREYDVLLSMVQERWRSSLLFTLSKRTRVRREFLVEHGWRDSDRGSRLLNRQEVSDCHPREVAAMLLCLREGLEPCHPQTFAAALAYSRKIHEPAWDPKISHKRRGRPPKVRAFSPTAPRSG